MRRERYERLPCSRRIAGRLTITNRFLRRTATPVTVEITILLDPRQVKKCITLTDDGAVVMTDDERLSW